MRVCLFLALATTSVAPLAAQDRQEKLQGYAEYVRGATLIVDGQRVQSDGRTRFAGAGAAALTSIPLGYEVKVQGRRLADGSVLAAKVEAKPNGEDASEAQVRAASDEAERAWVEKKMMFEPGPDGKVVKIGDILESGPYVERARRIMDRLRPAYVPASALRVRVVRTEQWNASAMANGAVWVYSGLMDAMDDDELAIVLGHELTHYTHEHVRRSVKKNMFGQIAAAASAVAASQVSNAAAQQAIALGGQLGASALVSGYSREFEDQADRVGLRYVYEAGYDPTKGPKIWMKFKDKYGEQDKLTNFFVGDHARPTERIRNIEEQIRYNYSAPRSR